MTTHLLLTELTLRVRTEAHSRTSSACPCGAATLADRPDATVVRHAGTVAKAHAPDTTRAELAPRLSVAANLLGVLLPPLAPTPTDLHGRLVTFWPYGTPVDAEKPEAAPWEAAATLLAHLHRTPAPTGLPPMRGPAKAALAVARLLATTGHGTTGTGPTGNGTTRHTPTPHTPTPHPAIAPILRAWATLPPWARAESPMPDTTTLCHGDLHLGQLVRHPAPDGPWRLIDVDDLGTGVPAWDLARPAAWFACGLLAPEDWARFLAAYRAAGGPAVPPDGDPWPALDTPARALTVQTAARAVAKAVAADRPLDDVEEAVVDACDRMGSAPPELADDSAK